MLWMYMAMLETAEQKDKIAYIYENYADRKSTRLNSSHSGESRMPSSA